MILSLLLALASQWTPTAVERTPHQPGQPGTQFWTRVALAPDSSTWVAWSAAGEVYARHFDESGAALSGSIHVNTTTHLQQDECELIVLANGNVVVAWSCRSGFYTVYMNGNACVLSPTGAFVRTEFSLSDLTTYDPGESRWRPMLLARRDGTFAAIETVGWNEDVILMLFHASGQPLGPDILVNAGIGDREQYPTISETKSGALLAAWTTDVSAAPGDIIGRSLSPLGIPTGSPVALTSDTFKATNEEEPRLASNQRGHTVLVGHGGGDVWVHLFGPGLKPRGQPFKASIGSGVQRDGAVAIDAQGNFVVVFSNDFTNAIEAVWYDANGVELQRFQVNSLPLGQKYAGQKGRRTPSASMNVAGDRVVFGWSGGTPSSGDVDAYFRVYVR